MLPNYNNYNKRITRLYTRDVIYFTVMILNLYGDENTQCLKSSPTLSEHWAVSPSRMGCREAPNLEDITYSIQGN